MAAEVIGILLDAIEAVFAGIGTGLSTVFETVIYNQETGITTLGEWMIVFMGVSFALSVFYRLLRKVA